VANEPLLISAAIFMFAFGMLVTVLERIRHPPTTPVITFAGIAGVTWDYVPPWSICAG
jgi:hypothetical protein